MRRVALLLALLTGLDAGATRADAPAPGPFPPALRSRVVAGRHEALDAPPLSTAIARRFSRALARVGRDVAACHADLAARGASVTGDLTLEWPVDAGGRVAEVRTLSDTTGSSALLACISTRVPHRRFPARVAAAWRVRAAWRVEVRAGPAEPTPGAR